MSRPPPPIDDTASRSPLDRHRSVFTMLSSPPPSPPYDSRNKVRNQPVAVSTEAPTIDRLSSSSSSAHSSRKSFDSLVYSSTDDSDKTVHTSGGRIPPSITTPHPDGISSANHDSLLGILPPGLSTLAEETEEDRADDDEATEQFNTAVTAISSASSSSGAELNEMFLMDTEWLMNENSITETSDTNRSVSQLIEAHFIATPPRPSVAHTKKEGSPHTGTRSGPHSSGSKTGLVAKRVDGGFVVDADWLTGRCARMSSWTDSDTEDTRSKSPKRFACIDGTISYRRTDHTSSWPLGGPHTISQSSPSLNVLLPGSDAKTVFNIWSQDGEVASPNVGRQTSPAQEEDTGGSDGDTASLSVKTYTQRTCSPSNSSDGISAVTEDGLFSEALKATYDDVGLYAIPGVPKIRRLLEASPDIQANKDNPTDAKTGERLEVSALLTRPSAFLIPEDIVRAAGARPYEQLYRDTSPFWDERENISFDKLIEKVFHAIDAGKKGFVDTEDIEFLLETACTRHKIPIVPAVRHRAAIALIEDARSIDGQEASERHLSLEQFRTLIHDDRSFRDLVEKDTRVDGKGVLVVPSIEETSEVWEVQPRGWSNARRIKFWCVMYLLVASILCGIKVWYLYKLDHKAVSWAVMVAKGSAAVLNLNAGLVLLPVSRHFTTWFQAKGSRLAKLMAIPSDLHHSSHAFLGYSSALFSAIHTLSHVVNYVELILADTPADFEASIGSLAGFQYTRTPNTKIGRFWSLLQWRSSWTGAGMLGCLVLAMWALRFRKEKTRFNTFWSFHHLLIVFLILQCVHGTGNLLERFQAPYWIVVPLTMYLIPRINRQIKSPSSVNDVKIFRIRGHDDALEIALRKPPRWETKLKAGMYAFLNVPAISKVEWHPFTLSSCPSDPHVGFHIRCLGDWTKSLKRHIEDMPLPVEELVVRIDGPFGSPTLRYKQYPAVVLIAAGIGVTPMISVASQLLREASHVKAVVFYWAAPAQGCFSWFTKQLQDMNQSVGKQSAPYMQIRQFLTSAKNDYLDLGAILTYRAANLIHADCGLDVLANQHSHVPLQIGRPSWNKEFAFLNQLYRDVPKVGVFLCGPHGLAKNVHKECSGKKKFHFHKEIF